MEKRFMSWEDICICEDFTLKQKIICLSSEEWIETKNNFIKIPIDKIVNSMI